MRTVNVEAVDTPLSDLLDEVANGEEIIIAKAGTPVAKLVAVSPRTFLPLGVLEGEFTVPDDFDTAFNREIWSGSEFEDSRPEKSGVG